MAHELEEGKTEDLAQAGPGRQEVHQREQREGQAHEETDEEFDREVLAAPPWEALVPHLGYQLLAVGMSHELRRDMTRILKRPALRK